MRPSPQRRAPITLNGGLAHESKGAPAILWVVAPLRGKGCLLFLLLFTIPIIFRKGGYVMRVTSTQPSGPHCEIEPRLVRDPDRLEELCSSSLPRHEIAGQGWRPDLTAG